jgi:hypothetical protein
LRLARLETWESQNVCETIVSGGNLTNIYGLSLTEKGKCQSSQVFSIYIRRPQPAYELTPPIYEVEPSKKFARYSATAIVQIDTTHL